MILQSDISSLIDDLEIEEHQSFLSAIESSVYIPENKTFWSLYRTPFFQFVLDNLEYELIDTLSLMIPSQIGKSQLLSAIAIEWARRYPGELVLYYCPTDTNALDTMQKKIIPTIEASPVYHDLLIRCSNGSIDKQAVTKNSIRFLNGSEIKVLGVAGKTALISKTASLVILDEYARMRTLAKDSGDILSLAKRRMTAKAWGNRKMLVASTPLNPHETIHKLWEESSQITWEVPCPSCGVYQFLAFENLKWSPKPSEDMPYSQYIDMIRDDRLDVYYQCPHCNHHIKDNEKSIIINKGRCVHSGNNHLSDKKVSMHLNGLYSLEHWSTLAGDFLDCKNDPMKWIEYKQQVLCVPWEADNLQKNLSTKDFGRGEYPRGIVPSDTLHVVEGIDIQDDRFYRVQIAYTLSKKIYLVDWEVIPYDINNITDPDNKIFQLEKNDLVDMLIMDAGDGGNYAANMDLAQALNKCQPIKGYREKFSSNVPMVKKNDPDLLFVGIQTSNSIFEKLLGTKTFLFPSNIKDSDEILTHICNVVKRNGVYEDRTKSTKVDRRDYRDAIRYAISWMYFADYSTEADREVYLKDHRKDAEAQERDNLAALNNVFGGGLF